MVVSDRTVLVLYGSETGNAQDMAEELGGSFRRLRFQATVQELDAADLGALLDHGLVVFVVSTTGQGDMPHNSLAFWRKLLRKKLPPGCLAPLRYTCLGLGDSTYIKFVCRGIPPLIPPRLTPTLFLKVQLGGAQADPAAGAARRHCLHGPV